MVASIRSGGRTDLALLARSIGVAVLIAALAVAAAVPGAWVVRSARAAGVALLAAPMLLPSYLAFTGWGVLRSPDTAVGRWLLQGDPGDANRLPVLAGQVLAVGGLVLWVWPLAAVILGWRLRQVEDSVFESLAMDSRSRWRAAWEVAVMCRGGVFAAGMMVTVLMLGSAIPLHLAQLDTYAIKIWRVLDQTPRDEIGRVWASAWPLIAVAGACGAVVARRLLATDSEMWADRRVDDRRVKRGWTMGVWPLWRVTTASMWMMGVLVPVGLLVWSVRSWGGALRSMEISRGPMVSSALVAAVVGAAVIVTSIWMWWALAQRGKGKTGTWRVVVGVGGWVGGGLMLAVGLLPGVLVGMATARAWSGWRIGDSPVVVMLAHFARFGMVGVLLGWWLAATEGRWARDLRRMEVGEHFRGWWEAAIRSQVGLIAAGGLIAAMLSFHEIEATVLVQPASASGGSFAWQMLQWLHFARMDELAMGVLMVVGMGVGGLALTCLLLSPRNHAPDATSPVQNRPGVGNSEPFLG